MMGGPELNRNAKSQLASGPARRFSHPPGADNTHQLAGAQLLTSHRTVSITPTVTARHAED